jgi:4-methyl-5(b-hydroxyethyl)-thiazole monophosphate biosynthesis
MKKSIIISLAQGSEELEAVTIINILRRADLNVVIYSKDDIITCARGTKIIPDINSLNAIAHEEVDAIVLPGGLVGVENLSSDEKLINLIKQINEENKIIGAICAAPLILHNHRLIDLNCVLTSHPSVKSQLSSYNYVEDNVVVYDNIITSRGVGTALDFSFTIVELLLNEETVNQIKEDIVYSGN